MAGTSLLHPDEARKLMLSTEQRVSTERVATADAAGRVLQSPVSAPFDAPAFDKSAMDGWAVRSTKTGWTYRLRGEVAAGAEAGDELAEGECVRIMTGAPVPKRADQVIRVENGRQEDGIVTVQQMEPNDNIIRRGSLTRSGDMIMQPRLLRPVDVGILASFGIAHLEVARLPRVSVLSTGNELKPLGAELAAAAIYNSNGPQLLSQLRSDGFPAVDGGIVSDQPEALNAALGEAVEQSDVVVLTGGVSMGDYDYVPASLASLGFETLFHRIGLKPGKPTLYASRGDGRFAFGLPGNPISAFVVYQLFVKPFLFHLMGVQAPSLTVRARLSEEIARTAADRLEYRPVYLNAGCAQPAAYRGSAHLSAFSNANGLVRIEIGTHILEAESEVDVVLF